MNLSWMGWDESLTIPHVVKIYSMVWFIGIYFFNLSKSLDFYKQCYWLGYRSCAISPGTALYLIQLWSFVSDEYETELLFCARIM